MSRENYLRVSAILNPFSGLDKIDPDVVAHAAERGTKVHKICESIIKGYGEIGIEDETWGYVESFKKWWNEDIKPLMIEKRFWCDDLKITGQVDLIIKNEQGLTLIDFKTSSKPSKTWIVQASAYYYLATIAGHDIQKIFFIHLNKHGKEPKIYEYPCSSSFFLTVLSVFKHFWGEK